MNNSNKNTGINKDAGSLRIEIRGEWLIQPANSKDKWDFNDTGSGITITSNSASDSECNHVPKSMCKFHPNKNLIYVNSGRLEKNIHPGEIWGEVTLTLGLITANLTADIIFTPPHSNLDTDAYIGLAFPEKDDSIPFEEKRNHGYGEHLHGPFKNRRSIS